MVEKVNEIIKEVEKLEKDLMGMFSLSDLADADDETIKMFKSYANLMNLSKDLMLAQATMLDGIDHKLNNIHERLLLKD